MIVNKYSDIEITAMACAVPDNYISIESLKNGENNEVLDRFVKNTSVVGHYECLAQQTAADLGEVAARQIIEEFGINKNEIGVLLYVTQYPDYRNPSTACVLQHRIGLGNDCMAFDVNLGCSGFVYGMNVVSSLLHNSNAKYGLLLAGDSPSKGNRTDNSRNLFGDACSATLFIHKESCEEIAIASRTDGSGFRTMWGVSGSKHQDVDRSVSFNDEIGVFNFAIEQAPKLINEFMDYQGKTPFDFDVLALHQANMMIMKQIVKRTHFEKEKMLISIDKFANTSAASIPLCFVERYGNNNNAGTLNVLACGYGIGLSWAAASLKIDCKVIMPLIKTNYWFDDHLNDYMNK